MNTACSFETMPDGQKTFAVSDLTDGVGALKVSQPSFVCVHTMSKLARAEDIAWLGDCPFCDISVQIVLCHRSNSFLEEKDWCAGCGLSVLDPYCLYRTATLTASQRREGKEIGEVSICDNCADILDSTLEEESEGEKEDIVMYFKGG